jgi:hypothetical protein
MTAIDHYREMVQAYFAQRERLGIAALDSRRWSEVAPGYRFDPHRELGTNLSVLASYVEPDDVVVEVGGGAGRTALPLALTCKHVVNVEPAEGMRVEFESLAAEAEIANVTLVASTWEDAPELSTDIALVVDVTYFVAEIEPFLAKLDTTAGRRAIVSIWDPPPPNWDATLFELVHGEPLAPVPGQQALLPVLWEMGVLPEVLILPEPFSWPSPTLESREEAARYALGDVEAEPGGEQEQRLESEFDSLFRYEAGEFHPRWRPEAPGVLITWEAGQRRDGVGA